MRPSKEGVAVARIRCLHCAPQNAEWLTHLYGITEEAPEGENLQAQAPQAHEGESPQEAFALQVVTASALRSTPSHHRATRRRVRGLRGIRRAARLPGMKMKPRWLRVPLRCLLPVGIFAFSIFEAGARPPLTADAAPRAIPVKHGGEVDDSLRRNPAADLMLDKPNERRAEALANFVEGARLEESGEVDAALGYYQKVLTVHPGEVELASRVASLLTRQEDFPRAIDILKDAIKANPKENGPYLQLSYLYAKYLQKPDQALKFANQAIALDPENIDGYQRAYELELAGGDAKKALAVLDRAAKTNSRNPTFLTQLGKLYASVLFQPNTDAKTEDLRRVNAIFKRAAENANDDPAVLKDVGDYFAGSQQIQEAIPYYLRALELQPDDANAREKLATGFVLTNQRAKAMDLLQEIIKQTPEKYQPYELLAQLHDDEGRSLLRANQRDDAKAEFEKAAANYEQSLLINPRHGQTIIRLAELLIGPLKNTERAEKLLTEARARFPRAPVFAYFLALAQRESKHAQQAIITFEEALHEAETDAPELLTARFFFDYGAAADQAGLYDKAADLLKHSIALDPGNAAEAYNYLGFMWAEHNMHLDEAEQMVKQALELDPDNGAFLDSLGWVQFRKSRFEEALGNLLRAAQNMKRDDPVVFDHIGDTYAKLNRVPQALEFWQKAMALDPDNKMLAEKIQSTQTQLSKGEPTKVPPIR
jgi:tetratricopeptide (TPR) repeat protein